jgi:hypothetical protein
MDLGEVVKNKTNNHPVSDPLYIACPCKVNCCGSEPPPDFTSFHMGQALLNQEGKRIHLISKLSAESVRQLDQKDIVGMSAE